MNAATETMNATRMPFAWTMLEVIIADVTAASVEMDFNAYVCSYKTI